jgi:hypothetical protein
VTPDVAVMQARRRRRQAQAQYRLPDWVWGLALGLLVVLAGGGYLLFSSVTGGGGGTCDKALPKLPGTVEVTAEGFQEEDRLLSEMIDFLAAGDLDNASAKFYGEAHAFTHNADPDIREVDEDAARAVCQATLDVEAALEGPSLSEMSSTAIKLRDELRNAAVALGFPRPG